MINGIKFRLVLAVVFFFLFTSRNVIGLQKKFSTVLEGQHLQEYTSYLFHFLFKSPEDPVMEVDLHFFMEFGVHVAYPRLGYSQTTQYLQL